MCLVTGNMLVMQCDMIDLMLVALSLVIYLRVLFIFLIRPMLVPFGLMEYVFLQPMLFVVLLFGGIHRWLYVLVGQQLNVLPNSTFLNVMQWYSTLLVDF